MGGGISHWAAKHGPLLLPGPCIAFRSWIAKAELDGMGVLGGDLDVALDIKESCPWLCKSWFPNNGWKLRKVLT